MTMIDVLAILTLISGFVLSVGLGGNNVSNAFATCLGSKIISLPQAFVFAMAAEIFGIMMLAPLITLPQFVLPLAVLSDKITVASCFGASFSVALTVLVASLFALPISGRQCLFTAALVFRLIYEEKMPAIQQATTPILYWTGSPVILALISGIVYHFCHTAIYADAEPLAYAMRLIPYLFSSLLALISAYITFQLLNEIRYQSWLTLIIFSAVAGSVFPFMYYFGAPRLKRRVFFKYPQEVQHYLTQRSERAVRDQAEQRGMVVNTADLEASSDEKSLKSAQEESKASLSALRTEELFVYLQLIGASFLAMVQGAFDGHLVVSLMDLAYIRAWVPKTEGLLPGPSSPPIWMYVIVACGVCTGITTIGRYVIRTVGKELAPITPSRGFSSIFASVLFFCASIWTSYGFSLTQLSLVSILTVAAAHDWRKIARTPLLHVGMATIAAPIFAALVSIPFAVIIRVFF